jgi:HAMP domain-containing protein
MVIRKLIAPTVVTLLMFGLWIDYLFFRDYPWSVVNLLSKLLEILIRVFEPLFDPALYWWVGEIVVPVVMILCAVVLLYVSVAKAKVAMSKATLSVDDIVTLPPVSQPASPPAPVEEESAAPAVTRKAWKLGLVGKMAASFGTLGLLFGVAASIIVYARVGGALEAEIRRRATVFVVGLSDVAARYAPSQGELELRQTVEKYGSRKSVAYVYVEDGAGRIIAHMPPELPILLRRDFPNSAERALKGVEGDYRGSPVYEITARVESRTGGYVHVAIWRDAIEEETRRVVTPIAASILVLLSGLALLFAWVVWHLSLPFIKLVDFTSRISRGELDLEVDVAETGEVGDLARSFERMRSSLHAVLNRLEEADSMERSNRQG